MATITIKSDKADDIYFINELARRLNLETEIKTPDNEIGGRVVNGNKTEDKKLIEMISYNGRLTIGKILENESGDIF